MKTGEKEFGRDGASGNGHNGACVSLSQLGGGEFHIFTGYYCHRVGGFTKEENISLVESVMPKDTDSDQIKRGM